MNLLELKKELARLGLDADVTRKDVTELMNEANMVGDNCTVRSCRDVLARDQVQDAVFSIILSARLNAHLSQVGQGG